MNKKYITLGLLIGIFAFTNCFSMESFRHFGKKFTSKNSKTITEVPELCSICQENLYARPHLIQTYGCVCSAPRFYHKKCWKQFSNFKVKKHKELVCLFCSQSLESTEEVSSMSEGKPLSDTELNLRFQINFSKYQYKQLQNLENINKHLQDEVQQLKDMSLYKFKEIITPVAFGCTAGVLLTSLFQVDEPGKVIACGGALGSLGGVLSSAKKVLLVDEQMQDAEKKIEAIFYGTFLPHVACCSAILAGICFNHFSCWAIPAK